MANKSTTGASITYHKTEGENEDERGKLFSKSDNICYWSTNEGVLEFNIEYAEMGGIMTEIKLMKELFESLENQQTIALEKMQTLLDEQQSILSAMGSNWEGNSGDSFYKGEKALLGQAIIAKMTLEQLKVKSMFAKEKFENKDSEVKTIFDKK